MTTYSESSHFCRFCRAGIDISEKLKTAINIDARGDLIPCLNCHSLSNITSGVETHCTSEVQALFHESFFGIDADSKNRYINDLQDLRNLVRYYSVYFGSKESELVCEIGSGRGSLLKALNDEGFYALGCEYSDNLVKAGRTSLELNDDIFFQLNAWDMPDYLKSKLIRPTVLVFWHVIEHIENSLALIESVKNISSDNITLIFQTPLPIPEYIYPEHLFFPSTETYHWLAERLGLTVKLMEVIPYTRFITCVLSNKPIPQGKVYPKQVEMHGFSVISQLITQLNQGLIELDLVTKNQYATITDLKSRLNPSKVSESEILNFSLRKCMLNFNSFWRRWLLPTR